MERVLPPSIEQVFEADPDADGDDGPHLLARPRSKLSQAERIAPENVRRTKRELERGRVAGDGFVVCWTG